jgi:nucleoside-diphosphate-sugar epimerase
MAALEEHVNVRTAEPGADLAAAMAGVEVAYLTADLRSPVQRLGRAARRTPHPFLEQAVAAAAAAGVRRLVALSSTAVYGFDAGPRVSERVWPRPRHPYERALAGDEAWLRTRDRPEVVVLRAAQGFGAAEPVSGRLFDRLAGGRLALPAWGCVERTFLAGADLAAALHAAALRGEPGVAYLAGGLRGTWRQLAETAAREMGTPAQLDRLSYRAAHLAAASGLGRTRLGRRWWPTPFVVDLLTRPQLVEDGWSRRELGWRPERTTFAEGLAGLEARRRAPAAAASREPGGRPEARRRIIT